MLLYQYLFPNLESKGHLKRLLGGVNEILYIKYAEQYLIIGIITTTVIVVIRLFT